MLRRILILLVLVGVGFGIYSLGKYIIEVSQRTQNASEEQKEEQDKAHTAQARDYADNIFEFNEYTPENYLPPNFDPFSNKYRPAPDYKEILGPSQAADTPPNGTFSISSQQKGFGDTENGSLASGTVNTQFIFRANSLQDKETVYDRLQVRFDFNGDNIPDTFFSRVKTARHTYDTPGIYTVTMEVLDGGGNVVSISRHFTVVENTEPYPFFTFTPKEGTPSTIFTFNTQKSSDSQYIRHYLEYRFDWDSDGKWDTQFERKTAWRHAYVAPGNYQVTMETRDPEGLMSQSSATLTVLENTPPVASFSTFSETYSNGRVRYIFDASATHDAQNQELLYRWDFNYTGENDIIFDSGFSSSKSASGVYDISGQKTVRLQVKDPDGAVSEAFVTFDAQGIY